MYFEFTTVTLLCLEEENVLRWNETPSYCDVFSIEINNEIQYNFIIFFFPST